MKKIAFTSVLVAFGVAAYWGFSMKKTAPKTSVLSASLVELSDEEYPDNPDLETRHPGYANFRLAEIHFAKREAAGRFDLHFVPEEPGAEPFVLPEVDLIEFMPAIHESAKGDAFLAKICLVNQEWNRNQVAFDVDFQMNGHRVSRLDLARNCLNAGLWELLLFTRDGLPEGGGERIIYHGWFDFPKELYAQLFALRNNGEPFDNHRQYLENWVNPENGVIDFGRLRRVVSEKTLAVEVKNSQMYPLAGERQRKQKEIIFPERYAKMADFLTDSARFATFSPPGIYVKNTPRATQLGRFRNLKTVIARRTVSAFQKDTLAELAFLFEDDNGRTTNFWLGGMDIARLPVLDPSDANRGQMFSMGIGNHPFYEKYASHGQHSAKTSPRFCLLADAENRFLDSHEVGIDGPLLHRDTAGHLHVWLLSFERHSLVGHFVLKGFNP